MRVVEEAAALEGEFDAARAESKAAFGDDTMYVERYVSRPRHIEFQVMADEHGHAIHLFERECSIQRRHQKLIEEAPSPAIDADLRGRMGAAAIRAVRAVDYVNAGTVEFLLDGEDFYFMEMNTRVQVEHPVTEFITGVDIIKEQIRIAAGEVMRHAEQVDVKMNGHAIEFRINAEDTEHDFRPNSSFGARHGTRRSRAPGVRSTSSSWWVSPRPSRSISRWSKTSSSRQATYILTSSSSVS